MVTYKRKETLNFKVTGMFSVVPCAILISLVIRQRPLEQVDKKPCNTMQVNNVNLVAAQQMSNNNCLRERLCYVLHEYCKCDMHS